MGNPSEQRTGNLIFIEFRQTKIKVEKGKTGNFIQHHTMFTKSLKAENIHLAKDHYKFGWISVVKKSKKGIMERYGGQSSFHCLVSWHISQCHKWLTIAHISGCVCSK